MCTHCVPSHCVSCERPLCESCTDADGCQDCGPAETMFKCIDCGRGYSLPVTHGGPFGDDKLKSCDGCGDNWVCIECNSLEAMNENGSDKYHCFDCNEDDDTYIDDINGDFDTNQEIEIMKLADFNDQYDYTTMSVFHPT